MIFDSPVYLVVMQSTIESDSKLEVLRRNKTVPRFVIEKAQAFKLAEVNSEKMQKIYKNRLRMNNLGVFLKYGLKLSKYTKLVDNQK